MDLKSLLGREFQLGEARMRGVEVCTPCPRPSAISKKPGFKEVFEGRGGIRAEVLQTGRVGLCDELLV